MAQNQKRIVTYEDHAEQLRPMVEHRGRAKFLTPFLRSSPECAQVETKQIYQRPDYVTPQEKKKNKKEMKKAGPTNPASVASHAPITPGTSSATPREFW